MPRNSSPRFYVDAALNAGARIALPTAVAHHAQRVLRLRTNDEIVLFNGRGGEYAAHLLGDGEAAIDRFDPVERESPLDLTLIQALVAVDKLDWVIEKAVELGVTRIVIASTERSVIRLDAERLRKRREHWQDVIVAACCQCGRNRLPPVEFAASLAAAITAASAERKLLLEPGATTALSAGAARSIAITIGPEGGFSAAELQSAERSGFTSVFFGPRVLRTETAGMAALAVLQLQHGDAQSPG